MTFQEYLAKRQARDNPQGDFVRDCRSDRAMPDVTTWPQLHFHLRSKRACPEAVEAGRLVWRSYQRQLKKNA
jgi:hypothetical protein